VIGLDTNVLVRFFQQDDPTQSARASALIGSFTSERRGFIANSVLVELAWVLTSKYKISRGDMANILERLLLAQEVVIEQAPVVWQALRVYRASKADFADCLIERIGAAAGCDYTVTYDREAAKTAGMRLLK
jgi:predicted nucleic-acid-binding protein